MQVEIVQDPLHGTAIVGGSVGYPPNEYLENGYLEFLPDSGWYGDHLLEYHVYDGQGYSNSATVSISIIRSSQMCDGTDIILNTPQAMPVRGAFPCGGSLEREIWLTSEPVARLTLNYTEHQMMNPTPLNSSTPLYRFYRDRYVFLQARRQFGIMRGLLRETGNRNDPCAGHPANAYP